MKNKALIFLYGLFICSMAITFLISRTENFIESKWFNIMGNFYFAIIAFVMILLTSKTLKSENNQDFTRALMAGLFIKFLLSALLFALYSTIFLPKGKVYAIPFILNYLIFSIYEVYFIQQLVKEK